MRDKKILGFYHPKGPTLAGVKNLASLQIDEICSYSVQKKKEIEAQSTEPASLTFHFVLRKLYTVPSIGVFYQISVHLPKRLQRRRSFLDIDQSEKRIACGGHVCQKRSGRNEQSL